MTAPTMIREAVVRYRGPARRVGEPMRAPADVARFVRNLVGADAREHFVVVMLDGRHRPIAYQVVSVGTATASLVHPREVFQAAVGAGAVAILVGLGYLLCAVRFLWNESTTSARGLLWSSLVYLPLLLLVLTWDHFQLLR